MHWIVRNALRQIHVEALCESGRTRLHHTDEDGHSIHKPNFFPLTASDLARSFKELKLPDEISHIDPHMNLYRLDPTCPGVARHVDQDFEGPGGTEARYSILVKLNDGYEGGETLVEGKEIRLRKGDALVFRHDIEHEGLPVLKGIKYMLKTDIFCEAA